MNFLRLVADFFAETRVRSQVISIVDKVTLGQFFSEHFGVFLRCQYYFADAPHSLIYTTP